MLVQLLAWTHRALKRTCNSPTVAPSCWVKLRERSRALAALVPLCESSNRHRRLQIPNRTSRLCLPRFLLLCLAARVGWFVGWLKLKRLSRYWLPLYQSVPMA